MQGAEAQVFPGNWMCRLRWLQAHSDVTLNYDLMQENKLGRSIRQVLVFQKQKEVITLE